jgi:N4-gp56 family major capsid protein
MADTNFGVNHPLAVKLWSKMLFYEQLKATWAKKFMGTGSNSLCQILDDTKKDAGDQIRWGLRMQLSGAGVAADNTLEGNEEALIFQYDQILVDQLRHATRSKGKMSEQRVPYELREEARQGLTDWFADRWDTWFFNHLAGNTAETDSRYYGFNVPVAPDANHYFSANNNTGEGSLSATTTWAFKLGDIDRAVAKAKTLTVPIRPIMVNGGEHYVLFLHPFQVYQLRRDTNTLQWADIQKASMSGGQISNNPIFTGALGMYNNVVMHEAVRIPTIVTAPASGTQADFRRAVFAGAQALALAFGQNQSQNKMSWVEELYDYKNSLGVAAGIIAGMKKAVFNTGAGGAAEDFATIVIGSYAPAV